MCLQNGALQDQVRNNSLFANIWNIVQGPVHNGNLNETCPDAGDYLAPEGNSRGDLHIMSQLKITAVELGLAKHNGAVN
jgi:hypothetical protein